jgi:hypothetical protein
MDILDLIKEKPANFDIKQSQHIVFISPKESTTNGVDIVLYDESSCSEAFSGNEIIDFVKNGKIQGVIVSSNKVKDILTLLMDVYPVMMHAVSKLDQRLKAANRISSLLSVLKLM